MIWTHAICRKCYEKHEPGRAPVRVPPEAGAAPETCCFCGSDSEGGIYYRAHPDLARFCPEVAAEARGKLA